MAFSSREVVEAKASSMRLFGPLSLSLKRTVVRETVEVNSAFKRAIAKHSEKEDLSKSKEGEVV